MSELSDLVASQIDHGVATLTINRPEKLNALNLEVKRLIEAHLLRLSADPAVRVIILTGGPTVFVAGTDIAEMRDLTPTQHLVEKTDGVFVALRDCRKILIAAVEGFALGGGCELALACDIIIAGETAKFGQPEIRVGIMPGAGGSQLLLRTIGKYRTMLLALTGEQIAASEALAMGMISEVAPHGQAIERAQARAKTIARMPPIAVASIKEAIRLGQEAPLQTALAAERNLFRLLFDTQDQTEGMQAFLDKRAPVYRGL
jgi:enoyl-CoA hydratase